jgi:outer membrane protein insertion porin family
MAMVRHWPISLLALLSAALGGCAAFDHSPRALARTLSKSETSKPDQKPVATRAAKPPIVRAQSPDGPTNEGYTRGPMRAAGNTEVAQYPLFNPPPAGAYTPIQPGNAAPQNAGQPPPGGVYGGPIGGANPNYQFEPNTGAGQQPAPPAFGQPFITQGDAVPGFPGAGPPMLGNRPPPPPNMTPLDVYVNETRTGKFMFGVGINSDMGATGNITIDERNFDIFNPPTSWDDFLNGTAWRGRGQGFRLTAQPGTQIQNYNLSFTEPYLFDTPITMSLSAFYFQRQYFDWFEERLGGRMAYGYRLTPNLSISTALRAEDVTITRPRVVGVPELQAVLGSNDFYSGRMIMVHDTRDTSFFATQGHYLELGLEQAFGEFSFPRADIDFRQYFNLRSRPDGTGKHTLALSSRVGFSGSDTPLFERYFAGGYSTMRGFAFRGMSPTDQTVRVGGTFQFLNSAEYFFPLTADDMIRGTIFCDYGTVEKTATIKDFRVSPGFGLLLSIPAMGPAPLAVNFAFPLNATDSDQRQVFSFFFGATR